MKLRHIISARQLDRKTLQKIFVLTDKIKSKKYNPNLLKGKIMATLFYEPSTRTRLSFESAMIRLGGAVIATESAAQFSSAAKGETLGDTVRVVENYADVIVLRHYNPGASAIAAKYSKVPIINAGDGNGEHPTQALLDLYTIFSKFPAKGRSASGGKLTVTMVGDLTNGRTIHSLSYLLSLYPKIKLIFVSPKTLAIPKSLKDVLTKDGVNFQETEDFRNGLAQADVIYQTRIQKERFKSIAEYQKYNGIYVIDKNSLKYLKKNAIIMHPLPRVNEITQEVDTDKRAIYFTQAQNGIYSRMALLTLIFDKT
jgi:aspartate carbamoyltransferase catalytic subunit